MGCMSVIGGFTLGCMLAGCIGWAGSELAGLVGGVLLQLVWWLVVLCGVLPVCVAGCIHWLQGGGADGFKWWTWR